MRSSSCRSPTEFVVNLGGVLSMLSRHRLLAAVALCCSAITFVTAQQSPSSGDPTGTDAQLLAGQYRSRHVVVVMEENRSIAVASEYMPYLKSLAVQYSQG